MPQDFALAVGSTVLDGGLLVKALLIAGLWLAGWGAARLAASLLPDAGAPGQFVAATLAIWNPYVAERLLQGHWSLLVGYGALPWVAHSVVRVRADGSGGWALAFWTALAGLTPTGLLMAAVVAVVCIAAPGAGRTRWRCGALAVGVAVLSALPWLTAAALAGSLGAYQSAGAPGFAAFAARAEPGLGTLGTLAGLGGIWNADAVPGTRTTLFALAATTVLLAVVLMGLPAAARSRGARPLLVLAAAAVLLPALLATGAGMAVLQPVVDAVPGLGVLRDGQKWVGLAMPGYAVCAAGCVVTLHRFRPAVVGALACAALIAVLPDLAWGAWGRVTPVRYPAGWSAAAAVINADPAPVAVLPADVMRQFDWAGTAPVLDPLPRWVRADVLATGDLSIGGATVPGEGGRARGVQRRLLAGAPAAELADAGVGWVVVQLGSRGEMGDAAKTLETLPAAYRDGDIAVYRVGGDSPGAGAGPRRAAVAAHLMWLAVLMGGAAGMVAPTIRQVIRARAGRPS